MNKFLITALTLTLATPALAQGMAAHDTMAAPSAMAAMAAWPMTA